MIRAMMLCLWAGASLAQTQLQFTTAVENPDAPIDVTADELNVDRETGTAIFSGNVVAIQEQMRVAADLIELRYDEKTEQVLEVVATGNVLFVTPNEEAEAAQARYAPQSRIVLMSGDVLIVQGSSSIAGDALQVNLATGRAEVSGRVRSIFGGE